MSFEFYSPGSLSRLPRRDLQKLCKRSDILAWTNVNRAGLKANAKNAELIEAIQEFFQITKIKQQPQQEEEETEKEEDVEMVNEEESESVKAVEQPAQTSSSVPSSPAPLPTAVTASIFASTSTSLLINPNEVAPAEPSPIRGVDTAAVTTEMESSIPMAAIVDEAIPTALVAIDDGEIIDNEEDNSAPLSNTIPVAEDFPPLEYFAPCNSNDDENQSENENGRARVDEKTEANDDAELIALEQEVAEMEQAIEKKTVEEQQEQQQKPAVGKLNARKSMVPVMKKSVESADAVNTKSKSMKKKSIAPIAAAPNKKRTATAAAASASTNQPITTAAPATTTKTMFTRKTATTTTSKPTKSTKKPTAAGSKKVESIDPTPIPFSPPSNSLASAFSLPSTFVSSTSSSNGLASTTSTSSTDSTNDAYWSLMAELDKRVGEKKKIEASTATAPVEIETVPTNLNAITATATKKTASKFDAIHKKAAAKTESIVEYQERLEAKKRAAAAATPLVVNKKQKRDDGQPSGSPMTAVKESSILPPFTMPIGVAGSFTTGVTLKTPCIAKRTRSSFKKEEAAKAAIATAPVSTKKVATVKKPAVGGKKKTVAAPLGSPVSNSDSKPLFSSRIPSVRSTSNAAPTAGPSTTFTQIACLEDLPKSHPTKGAPKKFDLSASLAKPLTWKPHKGKVKPLSSSDKENAAVENAMPLPKFDFPSSTNGAPLFTASVSKPSTNTDAPLTTRPAKKLRELTNIKNVKIKSDKESVDQD